MEVFAVLTALAGWVVWPHMCRGIFHHRHHNMAYVIFAHSHLYFKKSLHLVTHFFCLAHSAVRILVSTSYRAAGSPSAPRERQQKKKREKQPSKEKENKWDCYISSTLQHFRGSGRLSPFTRSAATVGRRRGLAGGSGFYCGMGVWMGGQRERVELQCMSGR